MCLCHQKMGTPNLSTIDDYRVNSTRQFDDLTALSIRLLLSDVQAPQTRSSHCRVREFPDKRKVGAGSRAARHNADGHAGWGRRLVNILVRTGVLSNSALHYRDFQDA